MERKNLLINDYICAGCPGIVYNTTEEERAIDVCLNVAKENQMRIFTWTCTQGICELDYDGNVILQVSVKDDIVPGEEVLNKGLTLVGENDENSNIIFCIIDFHPYINDPFVWRTAKDVFKIAKQNLISYIFISNNFKIPKELEHELVVIDMELPSKDKLKYIATDLCVQQQINISDKEIDKASESALGLTCSEAESLFAISLSKYGKFDLDIVNEVKRNIICKDGLLDYQRSSESFETVGGMHEFISYVSERTSAYSDEAREYGLPYPKGVLLVGIPGCGKSLAAKALSNAWQKPLLKLDLGKLFGSLVGDTESNTRKALQIAEAMSPSILWLDEIDKGLSGVNGSGKTDSGVTSRMFGTILTWLQEKEKPVYVIATANNISSLPDELLRKGRFDEIFFVDLPNKEERKEIFEIQIKKHKGDVANFDIEDLASISDGYNGSEIEECIVSAMFKAWNDGKRPYEAEDIKYAMEDLKPSSKGIMSETVLYLRKWSSEHNIRRANSAVKNEVVSNRKVGRAIKITNKEGE